MDTDPPAAALTTTIPAALVVPLVVSNVAAWAPLVTAFQLTLYALLSTYPLSRSVHPAQLDVKAVAGLYPTTTAMAASFVPVIESVVPVT
jgi:hypothetical protein